MKTVTLDLSTFKRKKELLILSDEIHEAKTHRVSMLILQGCAAILLTGAILSFFFN